MAGQKLTISEAIITMKTLRERHSELVGLRNTNAVHTTRYVGATDKAVESRELYDIAALDKTISNLAREIRKIDMAIKSANSLFKIEYEYDESVLGEVVAKA